MRLQNKKVIITGGSRGIGRAIAIGYAIEGAQVVITYVNDTLSTQKVVHEIESFGGKAQAIKFDLCAPEDASNLLKQSLSFLGQIDILVNNAGFMPTCNFFEITEDHLQQVIGGILIGTIRLTKEVCKQMRDQGFGGSILNISSISDKLNAQNVIPYECAKAGITRFTESLAGEVAQYGIRVNSISPGLTDTDLMNPIKSNSEFWNSFISETPIGRVGKPEYYVEMAIALVSDLNPHMTGSRVVIDGGRSLGPANLQYSKNAKDFWAKKKD